MKPQVFPLAPEQYSKDYINGLLRILTQYLNQEDAAKANLAGLYSQAFAVSQLNVGSVGITWSSGVGTPEAVVTAPVGSLFTRSDGGAGTTLYVKQSGTGNTGWVAK